MLKGVAAVNPLDRVVCERKGLLFDVEHEVDCRSALDINPEESISL
jgi:hypothetical protein